MGRFTFSLQLTETDVVQAVVSQVTLLRRFELRDTTNISRYLGISIWRVALATPSRPTCCAACPLPGGLHWVRGQQPTNNHICINSSSIALEQSPWSIT